MRERISRLISDRTRMLSAVSHDLRTPITRLRLRAEFIEEDKMREEIIRDLDRMKRMVNSALTYLRNGNDTEQMAAVDLPALIRTVIDNFQDVGEAVSYEGLNHLTISAQPDSMVRAIENLIDNGLKFGSEVAVRVRLDGDFVLVEVEDDGLGIPEAQRQAMLEPFVRGDAARSTPSGGFGLGLSITADIARAHGGEIELTSGQMGGLLARIRLRRMAPVALPLAAE
jgi:signal transduction histidine kinase